MFLKNIFLRSQILFKTFRSIFITHLYKESENPSSTGFFCTKQGRGWLILYDFRFPKLQISYPIVVRVPKKSGISYFQKCFNLTKIYFTEKLFILMARYNFWAFFGSEIIEIIVLGANGRYDVGWQPDGATGSPQPTSPSKSVQF